MNPNTPEGAERGFQRLSGGERAVTVGMQQDGVAKNQPHDLPPEQEAQEKWSYPPRRPS